MKLIDTHAHLDEQSFDTDRDDVLARALAGGIEAIITIGVGIDSSRAAIALAERYPQVYAAVGIHPNYCAQAQPDDFAVLQQLARHPRVVAVGETGLDRYWDFAPLELQREYFIRQIDLARSVHKPFIVHCRDAESETLELLRQAAAQGPLRGVMHSFCGSGDVAQDCLGMGLHVSFAGMLTYKRNEQLRAVARAIPPERLLVETDSPYLSPVPLRGKRNEPLNVVHTARCLAEIKGISLDELAELTSANARRLFSLA